MSSILNEHAKAGLAVMVFAASATLSIAASEVRAEFAKYYRQITGKDAPEGMVNFAIDPKISKSGRDAYAITSGWRASSPALAKTASVQQQDAVVARARELAALFDRLADVLELHTDYSLWESYQRLDAIEKIQNPDFTKTLFENAVNQYCLSHQYEAIRYVVAPAMAADNGEKDETRKKHR